MHYRRRGVSSFSREREPLLRRRDSFFPSGGGGGGKKSTEQRWRGARMFGVITKESVYQNEGKHFNITEGVVKVLEEALNEKKAFSFMGHIRGRS